MNKPERENTELMLILGANDTGKTTSIEKKLIEAELKKPTGRALVVVPDFLEYHGVQWWDPERDKNFKGVRKVLYEQSIFRNNGQELVLPGTLQKIIKHFSNGFLLFNDVRTYSNPNTERELHHIFIRRSKMMLDIAASAHGFTEVPPVFFTFATWLILFLTKDNLKRRKDILLDYDKIVEVQTRVNIRATDTAKAWVSDAVKDNIHYFEKIKK